MIRGILFDYGGTLDTDGVHWSEVLWQGFEAAGIGVPKADFRDAYVHGERMLARQPLVCPGHTMLDLLRMKADIETRYLTDNRLWDATETRRAAQAEAVARHCHAHVLHVLETSREVIRRLARRYPLVLVSNFYGNIRAILRDFRLEYFQAVVESAAVGIRKPDPRIFQMGVDALGMDSHEVLVVGDSFTKDIMPAASIGCRTAWIRGRGWGDEDADEHLPTTILGTIAQLETWLQTAG